MIRKILLVILICLAIFWIHLLMKEPTQQTQPTDNPVVQQVEPTLPPLPQAISEADMEQLSPEDAEKDQ